MFKHFHPFAPYINSDTKLLIMGTLPPPRFCTKELKADDSVVQRAIEKGIEFAKKGLFALLKEEDKRYLGLLS